MTHLFVLLSALLIAVCTLIGVIIYLRLHQKEPGMNREGFQPPPYETAAIDQYLYDRCCRYMTERRPFLVDSFSLQDLANAVYTNKLYLSKAINRFSGKNFKQYVNYYRVMYAVVPKEHGTAYYGNGAFGRFSFADRLSQEFQVRNGGATQPMVQPHA